MSLRIGVPKEVHLKERRVAVTPESAEQLQKLGYSVAIETRAGEAAPFPDDAYREAGAEFVENAKALWTQSDRRQAGSGGLESENRDRLRTLNGNRVCGCRQSAVLQGQHPNAIRTRQGEH